jgi:hypothetical protein
MEPREQERVFIRYLGFVDSGALKVHGISARTGVITIEG